MTLADDIRQWAEFHRWFTRIWFRFMQPSEAEWRRDWYAAPESAWWER